MINNNLMKRYHILNIHSQPCLLLQEAEAVLKSGLKHVPCKEDDEFMAEFEKMMNDSQQVGRS